MHGVSPEQFAVQVAIFLGPYYIALALMNGVMAFYLWKKPEQHAICRFKLGSVPLAVTSALVWLVVAALYVLLAAATACIATSATTTALA